MMVISSFFLLFHEFSCRYGDLEDGLSNQSFLIFFFFIRKKFITEEFPYIDHLSFHFLNFGNLNEHLFHRSRKLTRSFVILD